MNINKLSILLILIFVADLFLFAHSQLNSTLIRKVWIFWNTPIERAPLATQLCYEKIKNICQEQKWQLTLLNPHNLKPLINNYTRFQSIANKYQKKKIQIYADLVRMSVLENNGGVWLDISIILFQGLNWIEDLNERNWLITNKYDIADPNAILFYFSQHQDRYGQVVNGQLINYNPGYQIWFIYVKKGCQLIKDWKAAFEFLVQRDPEENFLFFMKENIWMTRVDYTYYLFGNQAIYWVIQKKQLQLDRALTLTNQRTNANTQYKIWSLESERGPFSFDVTASYTNVQMLTEPIEQIERKYLVNWFYGVKLISRAREQADKRIQSYLKLLKGKIDLQYYMYKRHPTKKQCQQTYFITQESVIGILMQDNQVAHRKNITLFPKQHQEIFRAFCQKLFLDQQTQIDRQRNQIKYNLLMRYQQVQRRFYVQFEQNNQLTFKQRLFFLVPYLQRFLNQLQDTLQKKVSIILIYLAVVTVFTILKQAIFCWKRGCKLKTKNFLSKLFELELFYKVLYLCLFVLVLVYYQFKYSKDSINMKFFAFLVSITILFHKMMKDRLLKSGKWHQPYIFFFVRNLEILKVAQFFMVFIFGGIIIQFFERRNQEEFSNPYLIGIAYVLSLVAQRLQKNQVIKKIPLIRLLNKFNSIIKYLTILFVLMLAFFPNIQFFVYDDRYLFQKGIDMILWYIDVQQGFIIGQIILGGLALLWGILRDAEERNIKRVLGFLLLLVFPLFYLPLLQSLLNQFMQAKPNYRKVHEFSRTVLKSILPFIFLNLSLILVDNRLLAKKSYSNYLNNVYYPSTLYITYIIQTIINIKFLSFFQSKVAQIFYKRPDKIQLVIKQNLQWIMLHGMCILFFRMVQSIVYLIHQDNFKKKNLARFEELNSQRIQMDEIKQQQLQADH